MMTQKNDSENTSGLRAEESGRKKLAHKTNNEGASPPGTFSMNRMRAPSPAGDSVNGSTSDILGGHPSCPLDQHALPAVRQQFSAYTLFFQHHRQLALNELEDQEQNNSKEGLADGSAAGEGQGVGTRRRGLQSSCGGASSPSSSHNFPALARSIAAKWKALSESERSFYERLVERANRAAEKKAGRRSCSSTTRENCKRRKRDAHHSPASSSTSTIIISSQQKNEKQEELLQLKMQHQKVVQILPKKQKRKQELGGSLSDPTNNSPTAGNASTPLLHDRQRQAGHIQKSASQLSKEQVKSFSVLAKDCCAKRTHLGSSSSMLKMTEQPEIKVASSNAVPRMTTPLMIDEACTLQLKYPKNHHPQDIRPPPPRSTLWPWPVASTTTLLPRPVRTNKCHHHQELNVGLQPEIKVPQDLRVEAFLFLQQQHLQRCMNQNHQRDVMLVFTPPVIKSSSSVDMVSTSSFSSHPSPQDGPACSCDIAPTTSTTTIAESTCNALSGSTSSATYSCFSNSSKTMDDKKNIATKLSPSTLPAQDASRKPGDMVNKDEEQQEQAEGSSSGVNRKISSSSSSCFLSTFSSSSSSLLVQPRFLSSLTDSLGEDCQKLFVSWFTRLEENNKE